MKKTVTLAALLLAACGIAIAQDGGSHRLMPLGEVVDYINAHGHLPEVPSAEEAEADGVDLGEMNRLLLQKVEELTLYVIDLQKQVEELKSNK